MSLRSRFAAVATAIALLAGSTVLISASPANASALELTVTSAADTAGTCPSASNCTLRQALTQMSSGYPDEIYDASITIAPEIGTIALTSTLSYDGGLNYAMNLTINGNGVTIAGDGSFQLFSTVTTGATEIHNATFTDGNSPDVGGAIFAGGALSIHDATFLDNVSVQQGGAVHSVGSVNLSNVTFERNSSAAGGAVFASGAITAVDSLFEDNIAQSSGAAIAAGGVASFTNTEFSINTVTSSQGDGGAVTLFGNSGTSTIQDSVFTANSGPGGGGAIRCSHALTVSRVSFTQNSAFNGTGGAIESDGNVTISETSFVQNLADIAGAVSGTTVTVSDSAFVENDAQIDIGAIYGNVITINRSSFDGNSAARDFGTVNSTGLLTVAQSSFTNNVAGRQIAVAQSNGAVSFVNTTIVGNSSQGPLVLGFGNVQLKYSTVTENVVTTNQNSLVIFSGGVISLFGNVLTNSSPNVEICSGATSSSGYNYANDTSCGLTAIGDNQNVSNDPMLGALGDHGGYTLTQLPLVGSPLIGAIPNSSCQTGGAPSFDQRGFARPNIPSGPCDIGAVQLTPQLNAILSGRTLTISITEFTSAATITLQSGSILLGTITVDATGSGTATYDLECSVPAGSQTVTASATGGQSATAAFDLEACTPEVIPVFAG